jgi:spermidine synthase
MYEIIWSRFFGLTFGSTTYSITTVLSAFMAGLAFGSLLFGRIADRIQRRLLFYGWIELLIGFYALAFPFLFRLSSRFYLSVIGPGELDMPQKLVLKFMLSFLIMLIPTTLMGGSLPVLSRFFIRSREGVSSKLGLLYAINTFGAVIGTYLVGFHMIATLGLNASIVTAALINIAIGIGIIFHALRSEQPEAPSEKGAFSSEKKPLAAKEKYIITFAIFAFMVSGFVALSHEVVWTRILSLIIGSSTYAFTMILIGFLIGIALGSYLISHTKMIPPDRIDITLFSYIQIGIGITTFLLIPLFSKLPVFMLNAFKLNPDSYSFISLYQFILSLLIVILPTTLMGATLPVIGKIVSREVRSVGTSIGNIYFFNTFGAIFGAFFAGFLFIPYLGTLSTLKLGIFINILLGMGGIFLATYQQAFRKTLFVSLAVGVFCLSVVWYSQWDTGLMDSGVSIYGKMITQKQGGYKGLKTGSRIVYLKEGINATISVRKSENAFTLKTNGKSDASTTRGDMTTQTLSGYLPLILHPNPRNALVIGFASGVTAGTIAQYDSIETLDIAEIESSMIEAAAFFKEVNHNVRENPKARFIINDGRNHLLETKEIYDIITSEPSNPWISGIGNLFTTDFFKLVKNKLNRGGIFCQWIQFYTMSPENLKMVLRTMTSSFEDVHLWISTLGDILLIASDSRIVISPDRIEEAMNFSEKTKKDFADYLLVEDPFEIPGRLFMDKSDIIDFSRGSQINSDNYPYLEFRAPKDLYRDNRTVIFKEITRISKAKIPEPLKNKSFTRNLAPFHLHRSKIYTDIMKWYRMGHYYIQKALELANERQELYFQLSKILLIEKRYEEAIRAVADGMAIKKTEEGIIQLINIHNTWGNIDRAYTVLEDNRDTLHSYEILYAFLLYKTGRYEKAIPFLERAMMKKQGEDYFLLYMIGECYNALNEPEKAETFYIRSIEREDMNLNAQKSLAALYWQAERFEKACPIYSFLERYWEIDDSAHQRLTECSSRIKRMI